MEKHKKYFLLYELIDRGSTMGLAREELKSQNSEDAIKESEDFIAECCEATEGEGISAKRVDVAQSIL